MSISALPIQIMNPDGSGPMSQAQIAGSPGSNIAAGNVAVGTTSTLVVPARTGRQYVTLTATSALAFSVGPTGVTTATGLLVPTNGTVGGSITLSTAAAIYAVGASAVTVSYAELY